MCKYVDNKVHVAIHTIQISEKSNTHSMEAMNCHYSLPALNQPFTTWHCHGVIKTSLKGPLK